MEKRKFEFDKYADMHEEKEVTGKDGTKVMVRDHVPYATKEAMAHDMAESIIMIHDESCTYESSDYNKIKMHMIAEYYTDIDTDGVEPETVADFLINNGMIYDIMDIVCDDFEEVEDILWRLQRSVAKTYEDDKSLTKAIRSNFGFLFTGEDINESISQAEHARDTLFEALGALRKLESERAEKIDDGKVMVGGNLISFAKKE